MYLRGQLLAPLISFAPARRPAPCLLPCVLLNSAFQKVPRAGKTGLRLPPSRTPSLHPFLVDFLDCPASLDSHDYSILERPFARAYRACSPRRRGLHSGGTTLAPAGKAPSASQCRLSSTNNTGPRSLPIPTASVRWWGFCPFYYHLLSPARFRLSFQKRKRPSFPASTDPTSLSRGWPRVIPIVARTAREAFPSEQKGGAHRRADASPIKPPRYPAPGRARDNHLAGSSCREAEPVHCSKAKPPQPGLSSAAAFPANPREQSACRSSLPLGPPHIIIEPARTQLARSACQ